MSAAVLDGKKVAHSLREALALHIATHIKKGLRRPHLVVFLLGDDPASTLYVQNKQKACESVGIQSTLHVLPSNTSQEKLLQQLQQYNIDPTVDGILVQLPLPTSISTEIIVENILPKKDVDGFHPYNMGRLAQSHPSKLRPCTPYGIMQLLAAYQLPIVGQHAVIVGASNIVGRPMALELALGQATVTLCHSKTQRLASLIQIADIIISATGKPNIIDPEWLSPHQVLIDVGIQRNAAGHLCGDVDYDRCKEKVAWITPVPGGVGPMTVTTLLQNTYAAYCDNLKLDVSA
ncbi:MAG: bifunctional methylenetetrahydrofolate dehydrogenase/methenyltetrahydrofolate cyclohydrolase FolD [Legionellaceae bacterium]|nr:bifunctional methylenetetrahydrofolate dehydrogenase/methenyltetrahydrofolate cyclohydrolase FolD [Legionellaceae bacterium]